MFMWSHICISSHMYVYASQCQWHSLSLLLFPFIFLMQQFFSSIVSFYLSYVAFFIPYRHYAWIYLIWYFQIGISHSQSFWYNLTFFSFMSFFNPNFLMRSCVRPQNALNRKSLGAGRLALPLQNQIREKYYFS